MSDQAKHVVTTVEQLEALPLGTIVKSSAGTVACRHSEFFGVVFGDERPFRWDLLALPATVLTDAPAPVDREALRKVITENIPPGSMWHSNQINRLLDDIERLSRG